MGNEVGSATDDGDIEGACVVSIGAFDVAASGASVGRKVGSIAIPEGPRVGPGTGIGGIVVGRLGFGVGCTSENEATRNNVSCQLSVLEENSRHKLTSVPGIGGVGVMFGGSVGELFGGGVGMMFGKGVGIIFGGGVGFILGGGVGSKFGSGVGKDPPEAGGVGTFDDGGNGLIFGDIVAAGFAVVPDTVGLAVVVFVEVVFGVG